MKSLKLSLIFLSIVLPTISFGQQQLVLPVGHTKLVRTANFSYDGKLVVTGGEDNVVNVWETLTGKKLRSLYNVTGNMKFAFFSDDGNYLAAGTDSMVVIWSLPEFSIIVESYNIRDILFAPDSKHLYLSDFDNKITQYQFPKMQIEQEYTDSVRLKNPQLDYYQKIAISPDNQFISFTHKSELTIRKTATGELVSKLQLGSRIIKTFFTQNGEFVVAATVEGVRTISMNEPTRFNTLTNEKIKNVWHSRNRRFMLTTYTSDDLYDKGLSVLWDLEKFEAVFKSDTSRAYLDSTKLRSEFLVDHDSLRFPSYFYSDPVITNDGKFIFFEFLLWNVANNSESFSSYRKPFDISSDGKYHLVSRGRVALLDFQQKKTITEYKSTGSVVRIAEISPDGNKLLTAQWGNTIQLFDIKTSRIIYTLRHQGIIYSAWFNKDGKTILSNSDDSTACVWDVETGRLIRKIENINPDISPAYYRSTGELALVKPVYDTVAVYDQYANIAGYQVVARSFSSTELNYLRNKESHTGRYQFENMGWGQRLIDSFGKHSARFNYRQGSYSGYIHNITIAFSDDDKYLAIAPSEYSDSLFVWDIESRVLRYSGVLPIANRDTLFASSITELLFTPDNRYLLVTDKNGVTRFISTTTYREEFKLNGQYCSMSAGGQFLTLINKGICDIYDLPKRNLLYRLLTIDSTNYLVIDGENRFDGTDAARKLLYFSCGLEIFELEQAKDQLWVPNLASRIMAGDAINNKTLQELNICGLTPNIRFVGIVNDSYKFNINPRRGGIGETVLFVNNIEAKRYRPAQLKKSSEGHVLVISKKELQDFFVSGTENTVSVKSYTSDNGISSRGAKVGIDNSQTPSSAPNLYAVLIGVSDYKGDELDLRYGAKDATDISFAIKNAAKKLLNSDGKEHVFVYNLTTSNNHLTPEKKRIKKTLEEIGQKATTNDILFIFFAGHGIMDGKKKQFYFLTADASQTSGTKELPEVGISTTELIEWMKPQNIKAQKRILIFDACNSGQAIKEIVRIGNSGQNYLAARNDEKSQQIKAIDKLNEKSGLFILSASASNQNAYEMSRYSQGLLTYALLKAIKQEPDILEEGKYLNVGRWFSAAEKTVSELVKGNGARQEPQVVSTTNFNIGIVDDEVRKTIVLPTEKPLFSASNFQNSDESIADDDLELSKIINFHLNEIASRGSDSRIIYSNATSSTDAYSISGRYEVKGNTIKVRVNIRQNKLLKKQFELSGTIDNLAEFAASIADYASKKVITD